MSRQYDQEHVPDDITVAKVRESHAHLMTQLEFDTEAGLADIRSRAKRDPSSTLRRRFAPINRGSRRSRWHYSIIYLTAAAIVTIFMVSLLSQTRDFGPGALGLPDRPNVNGGPAPAGHIAYQPPLLPISFSIDAHGEITIATNRKLVTPLGYVTVGNDVIIDAAGEPLPPRPADSTQLIICEVGTGQHCEAYQINTGRRIRIETNKVFVQTVERNRIAIDATPGSTINVTDNGPPAKPESFGPARVDVEEFHFQEAGEETDVDLERSRSGTITDLLYDHISGELRPIHGAKVALYHTYDWWSVPTTRRDYPNEQECLQKRPDDWQDAFSKDDLSAKYSTFCIRTAEGDLGFLFIEPDTRQKPVAYYVYTHTWVR